MVIRKIVHRSMLVLVDTYYKIVHLEGKVEKMKKEDIIYQLVMDMVLMVVLIYMVM